MKKMKKKLKAMTLVEIIVALAVFTIMSSLLAGSVAMVCNLSRRVDRVNKKISREAPAAEVQGTNIVTETDAVGSTVTLIVKPVTEAEGTLAIKIQDVSGTHTVKYDQNKIDDPKNDDDIRDFKYIVPKPVTD